MPAETKTPPPRGFTGADGVDADPMQLALWLESHGTSSIALRMPATDEWTVIGIDVDHYAMGEKIKRGADTLGAAVERWGALPATWRSSARGGDQPSAIYFFRAPAQRYSTVLGPDVEIIQRHHRYAVAWPSTHRGAGAQYRWYGPDGAPTEPPAPALLPELPAAWVAGLAEGAADATAAAAPVEAGEAMWAAILDDPREACGPMHSAILDALRLIAASNEGTRHDAADDRAWNLVQLAADGHPGLGHAFTELTAAWDAVTAGEDRADEWRRLFVTAARKAVTRTGRLVPLDRDACFERYLEVPAPAPGGPGEDTAQPIAPPKVWHVREAIGAHPFDPPFGLDQTLSEEVIRRVYPVLRYAYDAGTWLRRGPEYWEDITELSEWAISEVATLMPHGDPDAEKGSDAYEQAARRKRFMSSGPSTAIAKKMRALLAAGTHPASLAAARLDAEPWLLWAGGMPFDLRACADGPTFAAIDPATPHLRAAAVLPEMRPTPLWDAFTTAVWPDPELRAWAMRVLSVAVTGDPAKVLPLLVGEGDRGKTQVVLLIMSVLGSYAHAADPRLLGGVDKAHASIVIALKGRRLSFIDEAPRDGAASQERLKQLTGGGELTGNEMRRNPITFSPTHTLVLTANEAPLLTDPAVLKRVRYIECVGDPAEVIAARSAIGHPNGAAWRAEAPGVLAKLMAEAAGWLADERTARTEAAPAAYRKRAEEIAAEQNVVLNWVESMCEPHDAGTVSNELRKAFMGWARDLGLRDARIPSMTKWGTELNRLGYPAMKRRDGNYRALRIRPGSFWPSGGGLEPKSGGSVEGQQTNPPHGFNPPQPRESGPATLHAVDPVEGVDSSITRTHARTHTHMRNNAQNASTPSITLHSPANPGAVADPAPPHASPQPSTAEPRPFSRQISDKLRGIDPPLAQISAKAERSATKAEQRAADKAAKRDAAIVEASGELVDLPALVTRDGTVRPVSLEQVSAIAATFDMASELTVDVEHTGFWLGHADYRLRTIQAGTEHAALVLDADDGAQAAAAARLIAAAAVLHAHSATADLVPLAVAGLLEHDEAWTRMADTVIAAKLADPASTGSDPDLKNLAATVLGDTATAPAAEEARKQLFTAGKWLTDTKATTPVARSGWAQVDRRSTVMVRYAASDVLDAAALANRLPQPPAAILERERTAQRSTARVAHEGVRLDGDHIDAKLPEHQAALADAGARLQAFGIVNPGSDQQVAARLVELGAPLPTTKTGRPSVAKGAIEQFRKLNGPVGDIVRARLDYQHHETVIGLFLEPYSQLVHRGDGRARPTVYTLGADTGRMSCVRPNLQQVPRQGGIRACITADPGEAIISADFSSVEVRVGAALTGDTDLARMITEGVDLHWLVARQAYGPDATKEDRYNSKRGVFGYWYGSSIAGIARTLGITETEAAAIVASLDAMTPTMARWIQGLKHAVRSGLDHYDTYSGRRIHLDTRLPHKAFNYCVQGTARELLVDALVRWQDTPWANCRLIPVHDEVLAFVPEADAEQATAALADCMRSSLSLTGLAVDIAVEPSEPSHFWKDAS